RGEADRANRAFAHRHIARCLLKIFARSREDLLRDGAPQVLPPFGKRLGRKSQRALEKLGVDVRLNPMVTDVNEESVTYKNMKDDSEHTLTGAIKIWSAGVAASPLDRKSVV